MITKHPEHRHSSWKKLQCHPTPCSVWGRRYCYNYNVLSSVFTAANWSDHNTSANPRRKEEDSLQIADCHAEMNVHFYSVFIMTWMIQTCNRCLPMFGMNGEYNTHRRHLLPNSPCRKCLSALSPLYKSIWTLL